MQHPLLGQPISLDDDQVLPNAFELTSAVTVVCGLNGAGKTRLLRQLAGTIGESAKVIDVHRLCAWIQEELGKRTDLDALIEETGSMTIPPAQTEAARAIVGRQYTKVDWYSLEIADSPFEGLLGNDAVPYFVVEDRGVSYGATTMGLGELSVHLILCLLANLRGEQPIVLLDEPDAFVPPWTRELLLDHLASHAVTSKQAIVVTSHSREFIEGSLAREGVLVYLGRADGEDDGFGWPHRDGLKWPLFALVGVEVVMVADAVLGSCEVVARRAAAECDPSAVRACVGGVRWRSSGRGGSARTRCRCR